MALRNRITLLGPASFSQSSKEYAGARVYCGELLPSELNRLFEGIHFNIADPRYRMEFGSELLIYFVTAADYIWNLHDWEAAKSYKRAAIPQQI